MKTKAGGHVMTVQELRDALAGLPDNHPVYCVIQGFPYAGVVEVRDEERYDPECKVIALMIDPDHEANFCGNG